MLQAGYIHPPWGHGEDLAKRPADALCNKRKAIALKTPGAKTLTKEQSCINELQKLNRKLGTYQSLLLKYKCGMKKTTISLPLWKALGDRVREGEALRKVVVTLIAGGEKKMTGSMQKCKSAIQDFKTYEKNAKTEITQAKPFAK